MTMKVLKIAFVFVLFSVSEAALPDIGSCKFMEYLCDALKCQTRFFQQLQKDPNGDCSAKFTEMVKCVTKSINICTYDELPESQVNGIVHKSFNENALCSNGALPTFSPHYSGLPCSASFSSDANDCMRTFQQKFAADKSDPTLCQEQAKAKQCLRKLFDSECTLSSDEREILDLGFSDYNPFCDNNRDPGATGKGQCDGVRDLNNPYNAAAGLKSSVVQALLPVFVSLLFFVKF